MMAGIGPANTRPEMLLRRGLHALGWRYRLHDPRLPGKPDLVFPRRGAVVLVNGCFWHGHDCHLFRWPQSRARFWRDKISANVARDARNLAALTQAGWRVAEVWECTLKGRERWPAGDVLAAADAFLRGEEALVSIGTARRVDCALPDGPTGGGSVQRTR